MMDTLPVHQKVKARGDQSTHARRRTFLPSEVRSSLKRTMRTMSDWMGIAGMTLDVNWVSDAVVLCNRK